MEKRLVRRQDDRMLFGVAAGIAAYLNIDPVLVRLIFVIMTLAGGPGILIYLVMLIIMPEEGVMDGAKGHVFDEEEIIIKE
ncbi:MAG: PspC domain-containing protein [Ardenticatenaceae bacterium]|nr:PspC domain-containing protein [Ardenticatenaceae bacterium]